jgi:hypothetical protein
VQAGCRAHAGADEAVSVRRKRPGRVLRHHRSPHQQFAEAQRIDRCGELGLHEHRIVAILVDADGAEWNRLGAVTSLPPQHDAGQIAERIDIEQERRRAVDWWGRGGDVGRRPHRAEPA